MYINIIVFVLLLQGVLFSNSYRFPSEVKTPDKLANKSIEELFKSGEYDKACKLVDELYKNNPYNVSANLDYGKCATYRGDIDIAMAAYDRAEILDEEDADVHKHLGDLYAHIGNIEIANSEYDKADRFGKDIVERALDSAYSSNTFSVLARFSGGYDSNVDYNPELTAVSGLSDSFTKEYLRLTHTYDDDAFSSFYYKSQLHVYNKNYSDLSGLDFFQAEVYSGPAWASKDLDFWLPVSYTNMLTDYESYAELFSINPQFRQKFENEVLLKVEAEYSHQKYLQWDEGDKDIYSANLSLSRWFGKNYLRIFYRYLQVEKDLSDSPRIFIDKQFNEAEINYTLALTKSIELGVSYLYNKTIYGDFEREDLLQMFSAYISYNITKNVGLVVNYDHYDNETNYTTFDYKKEVLSAGVYFYY